MGSYTELKFKARLKPDLPENVREVLEDIFHNDGMKVRQNHAVFQLVTDIPDGMTIIKHKGIDHPFFECPRWFQLMRANQFQEEKAGGVLEWRDFSYVLELDTEFKNYDGEMELFLDFIRPYVASRKLRKYVGYWRNLSLNWGRHYIHLDCSGATEGELVFYW